MYKEIDPKKAIAEMKELQVAIKKLEQQAATIPTLSKCA